MDINTEKARNDLDVLDKQIGSLELQLQELREKRSELATFLRVCDDYYVPRIADMRDREVEEVVVEEVIAAVVGGGVTEPEPIALPDETETIVMPDETEPVATSALDAETSAVEPAPEPLITSAVEAGNVFTRYEPRYSLKRKKNRQTLVATELARCFEPGSILTIIEAAKRLQLPFERPHGSSKAHHLSSFISREADYKNGVLERIEPGKYRLKENARELAELTGGLV